MRISLLHFQDRTSQTVEVTWEELTQKLVRHSLTPCLPCLGKDCSFKRGASWSPSIYRDGTRGSVNVEEMWVGVFDIDHISREDMRALLKRVVAAGLAFILHTTHCHELGGQDDGAFRLVLRFSRVITAQEAPRVREQIIRELELLPDPKTKDLNRIYFLPTAPEGGSSPGASSREGKDVDVDAMLSRHAQHRPTLALVPAVALPAVEESASVNLKELRAVLKSAKYGNPEASEMVRRVLAGEALAEEGSRDDSINRAASALVFHTTQETPVEALAELMRVSVAKISGPPSAPWKTWQDIAVDKLRRAKGRRAEELAKWEAEQAADRAVFADMAALSDEQPSAGSGGAAVVPIIRAKESSTTYSSVQMEEWLREQRVGDLDVFRKRWIIQRQEAFFVFCGGRYLSPLTNRELAVSLPRDLARAPIALGFPAKSGDIKMMSPKQLLDEYATVARALQSSLVLQKSYYDPYTQTFHEAVCPLRNIQPREHPEVHRWLEMLGGTKKYKLLDWVASITRLDRQMAALIFHGKKSVGKTLFALGLGRLWSTGGPSRLGRVFEAFNDTLTQNPLIFSDESLPNVKNITALLRELIGTTVRELSRKYLPVSQLVGAVRLIVAGNNDRLFDRSEELSSEDLDAVNSRFLYVQPDPAAAEYLESLGGPPVLQKWIDEDKIAAHALWLRDARKVDESSRFLVEGESEEFHRHLITSTGTTAYATEYLVSWLTDHNTRGDVKGEAGILVGESLCMASTSAFTNPNAYDARVPSQRGKVPSVTRAGRALANLASSSYRILLGERQHRFHLLNVELLLGWAERNGSDVDELRRRLAQPSELLKEVKERYGI